MKAKKREVALRSGALVHKLGEHRYGELSSESEAYEAALQCIDRALTVCVLASVSEGQPLRGASLTNAMNSVELELVDAIELIRAAWDPYKDRARDAGTMGAAGIERAKRQLTL